MERWSFFAFVLVLVLVMSYSQQGLGNSELQTFGCEPDVLPNEPEKKFPDFGTATESQICYLEKIENIIPAGVSGEIPIVYNYEGKAIPGLKANISDSGVKLFVTKKENNTLIELPLEMTEMYGSGGSCKYYGFNFGRNSLSLNYELPATSQFIDGNESTRMLCTYSLQPIADDLAKVSNFAGLGPNFLESDFVCPELREQLKGKWKPCLFDKCKCETKICNVQIPSGQTNQYGLTFEKDNCGNRRVEVANEGMSMLYSERDNDLKDFLNKCNQLQSSTSDCYWLDMTALQQGNDRCADEGMLCKEVKQEYAGDSCEARKSLWRCEQCALCCPDPANSLYIERDSLSSALGNGFRILRLRIADNNKKYESCNTNVEGERDCYPNFQGVSCNSVKEVKFILKEGNNVVAEKNAFSNGVCLFEAGFNIDKSYIGSTFSFSTEIKLTDGRIKKFEDIKNIFIQPDTMPPNIIKGITDIASTLPVKFFILASESNEISFAEARLETNFGEFVVPLETARVYGDTFSLKGEWNPSLNPNEIVVEKTEIYLGDSYGNNRSIEFTQNIDILNDVFDCSAIKSASTANPINIILIPVHYSEQDYANVRFNSLSDALFSKYPFSAHVNDFNFYLLRQPADAEIISESVIGRYYGLISNECGIDVEDIHDTVFLVQSDNLSLRSHAGAGHQVTYTPFPQLALPFLSFIYVHETGHSFGKLADEYFGTYDNTHLNFISPDRSGDWSFNIDIEGCPKWCSGKLDTSSPFYLYYKSWKDCAYSFGFDMEDGHFINEEEIAKCWTDWNDRLQKDHGVALYDIDLGQECKQGTGCIFTSHGVTKWRSVLRGVMSDNLGSFGPISERILEERIQMYLSREAIPQTEILSLDVYGENVQTYTHNQIGAVYQNPSVFFVDNFDENGNLINGKTINLLELPYEKKVEIATKQRGKTGRMERAPNEIVVSELEIDDLINPRENLQSSDWS